MEADGCTLIDDVDEVTGELVDDDTFTLLVPLLATIWFVFVPPGTRGPILPRAVLRNAIQQETEALMDMLNLKTRSAVDDYIEAGPQPVLSKAMMGLVMSGTELMPKKERPSIEKQAVLNAVLRAVIAELDRAHRRL